jgi:uncharacterized membrane protein
MSGLRESQSRHNVNLWIVPLKMSLAALLLFAITMTPDMLAAYHVIHLPNWFTMGGIDDARAILGAMLGCVSTVLALIFSVALLVLSMVANLFGPRLLYRFVQDWVTQTTIGLFMGAFIYVFLVFLVTHQDMHSSFIPQVSLITSWFVVLAAFGFLVFYSHRVAMLIQNPDAVGRIVDDIRRAVDRAYPSNGAQHPSATASHTLPSKMTESMIVQSATSGYMQEINHQLLLDAANKNHVQIEIHFRPGQFVLEGEPLASISPPSQQGSLVNLIERSVTIGRHRVLVQDLEFGVAQIVEIAIRALSPAINDTFTGIACVDLLGETLTVFAEAPKNDGRWYAADGELRLQVPPLLVPRLVKQAFDQIRQAAADNPAVLIRLLSTIGRLAPRLRPQDERAALIEQAAAVWQTATSKECVEMDRKDIGAAWQQTRDRLEGSPEGDSRSVLEGVRVN